MKTEVREAFASSLTVIWEVMIGIAGIGLLASFFMKGLPLHTEIDKKWGLEGHVNLESVEEDKGSVETESHVLPVISS